MNARLAVITRAQRSCLSPRIAPSRAFQVDDEVVTPNAHGDKIWADDPTTGRRRDLTHEEDYAFWTFAVVESCVFTGCCGGQVASQERCKKPGRGLRSMRLMLCGGTDSFWWCRTGVGAALGQPGRWFEQRPA